MNGFKRASRRQAAVIGLAVLMGASFLGCHSGPRLFSKKDRDERTAKKELAEKDKDKSKFINRKKVRPESDYRDDSDEQIAKNDSKSKTKPTDAARKSSNDFAERAVASRQRPDDAKGTASRSAKTTASSPKTSKSADREEIVRRDTNKRPVSDLLDEDSLFDDKLPETRAVTKGLTAASSSSRSTAAKTKSLDEDPFKNSVIGPTTTNRSEKNRSEKKVSTVNFFDDEDLDEEMEEEAEKAESLPAPVAKKAVAKTAVATESANRRSLPSVSSNNRKFLDEIDEPANGSFRSLIRDEVPEVTDDEPVISPDARTVKRAADAAKTVAGQNVVDRRQQVQQTLDDWRREMRRDESPTNSEVDTSIPAPPTAARSNSVPTAKGHLSQASIDEFAPPAKSQGAVLNGELIIDTNNLPSRFQRPTGRPTEASNSSGTSGRVNSNSGANIDIAPGATQNRTRPAGQISLQSAIENREATGLTTAGFEQTSEPNDLGKLPALKFNVDSEAGPKLSALDDEASIAPVPPEELTDHVAGIGLEESSSSSRGWKRTLLVFAAMASTVAIGFGLRRRMELIPEPIRVPKQPRNDAEDPTSWPRG